MKYNCVGGKSMLLHVKLKGFCGSEVKVSVSELPQALNVLS